MSEGANVGEAFAAVLGVSRNDSMSLSGSIISGVVGSALGRADMGETLAATLGMARVHGTALNESVTTALGRSILDGTGVQDAFDAALGFARVDGTGLNEAILSSLGRSEYDSTLLSQLVHGLMGFDRADTSNVSELISGSIGSSITEATGLLQTVLSTVRSGSGSVITEAVESGLDSHTLTGAGITETLAGIFGVSSSAGAQLVDLVKSSIGGSAFVNANLGEVAVSALGVSPSDETVLVNLLAFGISTQISDASFIVDSTATSLGFSRPGVMSLAESIRSLVDRSLGDTAGVLESVLLSLPGGSPAVISDSTNAAIGGALSSGTGLDAVLTTVLGISHPENRALMESVWTMIPIPDSVSLGDSLLRTLGIVESDSASVVQGVSAALGQTRFESTALMDSVALTIPIPYPERPVLEETITSQMGHTASTLSRVGHVLAASFSMSRADDANLGESLNFVLSHLPKQEAALDTFVSTGVSASHSDSTGLLTTAGTSVEPDNQMSVWDSLAQSVGLKRADFAGLHQTIRVDLLSMFRDSAGLGAGVLTNAGFGRSDATALQEDVTTASLQRPSDSATFGRILTTGLGISWYDQGRVNESYVTGLGANALSGFGETLSTSLGLSYTGDMEMADTVRPRLSAVGRPLLAESVSEVRGKCCVDLAIEKISQTDVVAFGNQVESTFYVRNNGPETAPNVVLGVTFPEEVKLENHMISQGSCFLVGRDLICKLGEIGSRSYEKLEMEWSVGESAVGASVTNALVVWSRSTMVDNIPWVVIDNIPWNDESVETVEIAPPPTGLAFHIEQSTDEWDVSEPFTYRLSLENTGLWDLNGIILTDELPSGSQLVDAIPSQGTCTHENGTTLCDVGTLKPGVRAYVDVTVVAVSFDAPVIENRAYVSSEWIDPAFNPTTATALITLTGTSQTHPLYGSEPILLRPGFVLEEGIPGPLTRLWVSHQAWHDYQVGVVCRPGIVLEEGLPWRPGIPAPFNAIRR